MPKVATPEETLAQEVGIDEVGLNPSLATPERPIVTAKVVYLGSNPYMALSLRGRLLVEPREGRPPLKKPTRAGREHYDFTSRGTDGLPVEGRAMPSTHPVVEVRGKPYCGCSHIDHLYEFSQRRDESGQPMFKIIATADEMRIIEDYIQKQLRLKQSARQFADRVSA